MLLSAHNRKNTNYARICSHPNKFYKLIAKIECFIYFLFLYISNIYERHKNVKSNKFKSDLFHTGFF